MPSQQMTRVPLSCLKWCGLMAQPGRKENKLSGTSGPVKEWVVLPFETSPFPLRESCCWGICGNGRFCGEPVGEGNVDASLQSSEQTYLLLPDICGPAIVFFGKFVRDLLVLYTDCKEHCYHECDTPGFQEIVPPVSESYCVRSQHLWDAPSAENRRVPLGRP